jgi:hypothetical protein
MRRKSLYPILFSDSYGRPGVEGDNGVRFMSAVAVVRHNARSLSKNKIQVNHQRFSCEHGFQLVKNTGEV